MKLSIPLLAGLVSFSVVASTLLPLVWLVVYVALLAVASWLLMKAFASEVSESAQVSLSFGVLLIVLLTVAATGYGHLWLLESLSSRLAVDQDRLEVEVSLIPEVLEPQVSGVRITARVVDAPAAIANLQRVRLSWYSDHRSGNEPVFVPGCEVRVKAVLRAPRRFANPLLFDYEAYNLLRGIDAIGYMRDVIDHAGSAQDDCRANALTDVRSQWIDARLRDLHSDARPWVAGLVFAGKDAFSAEQWQLAQTTGTLHLLVVSGLHLGIMSVFVLGVAALVRRLFSVFFPVNVAVNLWLTLLVIVLLTGLYAWLAGFGISLFRSWLMLVLFWCLWMSLRRFDWMAVLSLVMMLALLVNPLIYTQLGFQLSFMAVAALLLVFQGQKSSRITTMVAPQVLVFVALLPLMLSWSMPVNLAQVATNVIAIPYVGLILLPLSLFNAVFHPDWAQSLLLTAGAGYWYLLELHQLWGTLNTALSMASWLSLLVLAVLILLWVTSLTFPINMMVPLAVMGVLLMGAAKPELRMLDVGQGLSVVVNDADKALVIDAGARYRGGFDLGEKVVAPHLRRQGVEQLQLLVTHSDNDHAGGVPVLMQQFAVDAIYEGQVGRRRVLSATSTSISIPTPTTAKNLSCRGDNYWRVMSPRVRYRFFKYNLPMANDNNQSCVVMVMFAGLRILVPGDVEVAAEHELVRLYGAELQADILIAPHHGSRTSSSAVFLDAVKPGQVWISSGFNNRFRHPHPAVVARYRDAGVLIMNTADHGSVALDDHGRVRFSRQGWQRPWLYP